MQYYIDVIKTAKNNAAKKAPADIAYICDEIGLKALKMPDIPYEKSVLYQKIWMLTTWSRHLAKILFTLKKGDTLLYQHPLYGTQILKILIPKLKKKGIKLIALIHDLNIIRNDSQSKNTDKTSVGIQDNLILKQFDKIICHNEKMKEFLINQGLNKESLITLEIFDYLCEYREKSNTQNADVTNCVIAGNLLPEKSAYIYKLTQLLSNNKTIKLSLYGNGYNEQAVTPSPSVEYCGSVSPEVLPSVITADYGIVWDGSECNTCTGHTGEYLRYNNPHKTSLYLASGTPVIIWKEAAMADFISKNHLGIVIDDLNHLSDAIKRVSKEEYTQIQNSVNKIQQNLINGYYFKKAFEKAVSE